MAIWGNLLESQYHLALPIKFVKDTQVTSTQDIPTSEAMKRIQKATAVQLAQVGVVHLSPNPKRG